MAYAELIRTDAIAALVLGPLQWTVEWMCFVAAMVAAAILVIAATGQRRP
jgi:hypothetical protein